MSRYYNIGKINRFNKIINLTSKRMIIVPLDHSVSYGPIEGLNNITELINKINIGGANAILGHKNIFFNIDNLKNNNISKILHLSASTTLNDNINSKNIISSVIDAVKLGADCVSIHINISTTDKNNSFLDQLGYISSECYEWGMPLLVMGYIIDNKLDSSNDKKIEHLVRICSDLGADIIKIQYPK